MFMKKPVAKPGKKPMGTSPLPPMSGLKPPAPAGKMKMPALPPTAVNPAKVPFQAPRV